jgi:hypothetical protein
VSVQTLRAGDPPRPAEGDRDPDAPDPDDPYEPGGEDEPPPGEREGE